MTAAPRVFAAPGRYLQGPGAFDRLGEVLRPFGPTPFIVTDAPVLALLQPRLDAAMAGAGLSPVVGLLEAEITYAAVADLLARCTGTQVGVVAGIGGGKVLDAAKAVSLQLAVPVVTVPSIASNDSPASGAIAMYDDAHVMISVDRLPSHPLTVVVDTDLIARAPVRFLRAGIGDAISKKFEADGCWAGTGLTPVGTRPMLAALAIADGCYRTIRVHATNALAACDRDEVTPALEAVVEAVILMSGLGFENGGLSVAHALTRGLVHARGAAKAMHGRHVAWGLLVQLAAEGRPESEVSELMRFYREIDLPVCLSELGMDDASAAEIDEIALLTMTAPHIVNLAVMIDAAAVAAAIRSVEQVARLI